MSPNVWQVIGLGLAGNGYAEEAMDEDLLEMVVTLLSAKDVQSKLGSWFLTCLEGVSSSFPAILR